MGIHQVKSLLKTYYSKQNTKDPNDYLQKSFSPECLQMNEFLDNFWDSTANENFDWTNIQDNKKSEENMKEKERYYTKEKYIIPELQLNQVIIDNLFSVESISEYKEAFNPPETKFFSKSFVKRMHIIMIGFIRKILASFNENSSLECIGKYFETENEEKSANAGIESGMHLLIKLLDNVPVNSKVTLETIDFLYVNSKFIRPLSFWGESKRHFLLDKSLNDIAYYLRKIVLNETDYDISYRSKSMKVLFNLAVAKGSLKNLLDFVQLTQLFNDPDNILDLNYELNLFKNEFIKLSLSYASQENMIVHSKLWGFQLKPSGKEIEERKTDTPNVSLTCDGSFVYLYSSKGYIAKIGTGYNNTMLGKTYKNKENYRVGEKGTIVWIENVLYYRSPVTDPNPLVEIDPVSLEEIQQNYELNSTLPNYLWVEGKKSEFEFPHSNYKDLSEIIEKKKNLGLEDKANLRPSSASPMTTDGRYIYVFSKWYDEVDAGIDQNAEDEEEGEESKANTNKKTSYSIYGVNVYDPLSNMMPIKSIKLNFKKEKNNTTEKEDIDLLKQGTILYTNGNILIVDKFKFNLVNGDETEICPAFTENLKTACYDLQNNVIWGITHKFEGYNEKIDLNCFFNHSAKPIIEYPLNHEKYMPCSLEKIIQFAEEKIQLRNKTHEVSMETFLKQSTLNILGLEDKFSTEFKSLENVLLKNEKPESDLFRKSIQCLILSTIAKLSEYYGQVSDLRSANTDVERGKILASACRRPYCVKLEPETFELLIFFLKQFSLNFFSSNEGRSSESVTLENYCLLSTIKILKTNLKCLSISALDLDLFIKNNSTNPFLKIKEFILRIFEVYHKESNSNDIIKALYEECKTILQVSVNTLYPDYKDIIDLLTKEMENFKESRYSRDIVLCLLEWMTIEDNMKNLLRKLKKEDILKIFEIFKIVSSWEINVFSTYIKNVNSLRKIPLYKLENSDETIAFKFSTNMQIEILKTISQKLLNDNYEEIENEQILQMFSDIIFENVFIIFKEIREFFENVPNILERDWKEMNQNDEEEIMIDTSKPVDAKEPTKDSNEPQSYEEYKDIKYKEIWTYIRDTILSQQILILRTFNFHIDCLSILSSNFIISSLMLRSFNNIIKEMNDIYNLLKDVEKGEIKEERNEYKELIFESEHPYLPSTTKWFTIDLPGEKEIILEFDPQSKCKTNCGYVQLYTDMNMSNYAFPEHVTLNENFPKTPLVCTKPPIYLYFYTDGCNNSSQYWGFKVKVHNGKKKTFVMTDDKFTAMMRSVAWVACKCSGQLLKGNFVKILQDDDDVKYNSILNSKLFAGGIDFEDVKKDNDQIVTNILNIFNNILPENEEHHNSSPNNLKEKKLLFNILNGDDLMSNKVLEVFQKKFSKEVVWAKIGGEHADKLVRAAYASLLRHSSQSQDFLELVSALELCEENENAESSEAIYYDLVSQHPKFMSLYKKWQAASRMRTWLIEKKKNVDEALERNKNVSSNKKTAEEEQKEIAEEEKKEIEDKNTSEEIMRKIIDQTIIKAKFLLKLNPSPAFVEGEGYKDKNILVRNTSLEMNNEDNWKNRLHQWKTVQKSKRVLHSVEEESQNTLSSLTSSIMMCLQSTVSSKRLLNKIKISTIRAKGREIGLIAIRNIFEKITHPNLVQDLLSWFCAALRKNDIKICHYLDNLQGCGKLFESRVQTAFQDFMVLLINKLISTEKISQIKSFVDALMWKFSANDHQFLVDQGLFMILWGQYNEQIKVTWGKPLKAPAMEIPEEHKPTLTENIDFSNDLIQIFEILANICLERSTVNEKHKKDNQNAKTNTAVANIKFPYLERQTSVLDENSSEGLILHILDVIFGEIHKALQSYLKYRGISSNLWKQYEKYEEEKNDDKKKKPVATAARVNTPPLNEGSIELSQPSLGDMSNDVAEEEKSSEEVIPETKDKDKDKNQSNNENADTPYSYDSSDLMNMYDEYREYVTRNSKPGKKNFCDGKTINKMVFNQNSEIYDPEFLNRLLIILYKCSCNMNEKILINLVNPLHFSHLIKLLRVCSTENKFLIAKILANVCPQIPEEILIESVDLFMQTNDYDPFMMNFSEKKKKLPHGEKIVFVELIFSIIEDIKKNVWTKSIESTGCHIVVHELIMILQRLWNIEGWNTILNVILEENLKLNLNENLLRKEILLSILGGEYVGQSIGSQVSIRADSVNQGVNFDFIKKDFNDHFNYGTIVGFSNNIEDFWLKKSGKEKDATKKKNDKPPVMYLTPNNNLENNVGVLLNDSLLKDEFNLNDVNPRTLLQHQIKVVQRNINFNNFNIKNENIKILLDFLLKNKECYDSETINFKTNIIRFLEKYFSQKIGFDALFSMEKQQINEVLMEIINLAGSQIKTNTNYLNLDLLEEKRYRLMNLATENNFSLGEIQKASICYRKPNMIIFRLSSDTLLNICYPILGVCNSANLMNFTDYMSLRVENENEVKDSSKIYVCNPENVLNAMNFGKKLIITYNFDSKSLDSKFKKQAETANISIVSIDVNHFKELICLYESIVNKNNKLEDSPLKNSFLDGSYKDMVEELELFGFPKEHITKELAKMKDNYDLNTLINNLMELKEKNKEEEVNVEKEESKMVTEEVKNDMEVEVGIDNNNVELKKVEKEVKVSDTEKNEEEDEFEIEPKNECFNCIDSDAKAVIPEYFEEMVIGENEDYNVIYRNFKTYNHRIIVFYARRIILNVLNRIYIDEENSEVYTEIIQKIPTELFVNILKLLTHEGLFLNSINWGSEILLKIKNLLTKIYSSTHPHCLEVSEYLIQNTKTCLEEIIKSKSSNYDFIIRNEEILIQKPMVFFSVWNLMIVNDIPNIKKFDYTFVLNVLAGLVLKIKENKQLRWFILELLVQLVNRITNNIRNDSSFVSQISEEMSFRDLENLTKLRKFLDESISRESKKNLSKRSQMICELLIFLEDLENKFKSSVSRNDNNKLNYLLNSDQKKDNFVSDLLLTFEMLKDFFDKKYLRYLAWTEINPEIVNSSKFVFESSHLYSKAPHTSLIHIPNTTALEITISNDTLLDNGDTLIFSLDKNCNHPVECYANRYSKKSFQINSSHTFTHFPANYITEIYTFGSNTFSRLGHSGNDVFSPKLVDSLSSCIVKDIAVGETFLFVLTQQGELLACGNGLAAGLKQLTSSFTKASNIQKPDKINCEGIGMIGVYNNSTIVMSQDFNLYSIGTNQYGQLGQGWTNPVNEITSMSFTKRLKQICVAESHALFVTIDNQIYSVGSNDYYQNGDVSTARSNNPRICVFDKGLSCEMISCGEFFSIFLMKDKITGKTKLYSAGDVKNGKTGQGKEEICHALKIINTTEIENLEWKSITSSRCSSAAITTTGKVFVWGSNSRGQLGLGHYNNVTEPTLVTFFEKYTVEQVAMSSEHTLFLVKDSNGKVSVFSCGDSSNGKLGETVTQKTEKKDSCPTPLKISFFEGKYPTNLYAGPRASVVLCKPPSFETLRDIHQNECNLCNKNPIIGNLSIEITDEMPKFYCNDCSKIAELSDPVPRIVLKAPVKEQSYLNQFISKVKEHLTDDNVEETVNVNCKNCKNICNNDNRWFYTFQDNKVKSYFCTECFDILPSCITGVKVYLKTQKLYKNLEEMNASNLYELSISYGYKFSITPVLNEKGCDSVIEKHQNSYNNFVEDLNDYNKFDVYEQYVDLLNNIAQKAERSIFTYSPKELSFKKEDLSVRASIEKCSSELLRKMFVILKILNNRTKDLLPFIDFSKVLSDNQRLSLYFNKITPLIFWDTKNEIIKYYFEKTASEFEVTELKINRMKARKFIDKGKPDHTGEFTVFGQMFQFLKQKSFRIFKKKEGGNNNKMFNVTFVGEASIDAGGPYREALSQICTEMQSACLPLFIPSPNQKNESGLFREKWIVNPSAKSITHLEMFKYIGGLLGYAMRTGEFMNLDLPSIFWKQLLEAPIERKDLEYIDRYTIQCLDDIINIHKKGVTQDTFSFYVDQKFTTCLSDGSEVELVPEGKTKEVTFVERVKYCELVEKVRLEESRIQMAAIRSGLEQVVPLGLLKLLSWKELETLVCGKPILDIDLLKQNTVYRGCSENDTVVQYFWKCLNEFSPEERSMYLRFVWGRSRLPLTSKDFSMKHRIEILHHNNPDIALPTSHTCFFSVEIPKYSTYELMKEKLKYAITNCQAIDTDGRAYEIWQDED